MTQSLRHKTAGTSKRHHFLPPKIPSYQKPSQKSLPITYIHSFCIDIFLRHKVSTKNIQEQRQPFDYFGKTRCHFCIFSEKGASVFLTCTVHINRVNNFNV